MEIQGKNIINTQNAAYVKQLLHRKDLKVLTGIKQFDAIIGGLIIGRYYNIQAPTGAGKTSFLLTILFSAAKNNPNEKFLYIDYELQYDGFQYRRLKYTHNYEDDIMENSEYFFNNVYDDNLYNTLPNIYYKMYDKTNKNFWEDTAKECKEKGIKYVFFDYIGCAVDSDDKVYLEMLNEADKISQFVRLNNIFVFSAQQTKTSILDLDIHNLPQTPLSYNYSANSSYVAHKVDIGMTLLKLEQEPFEHYYNFRLDIFKSRNSNKNGIYYFNMNLGTFKWINLNKRDQIILNGKYLPKLKEGKK